MDQPVYVIKSVESVWTYKYNGKIYDVLKKVVWILVILFIISSLFFHKNTFMELAFGTRLLLIIMSKWDRTLAVSLSTTTKEIPPLSIS